jgi:predicted lipoprotein with Yx(FWY)xxD motif
MAERIRKEHRMKGMILTIGAVAAALSLTYGLGAASGSSSSASASTKVGTASSQLGRILVDSHGRTLYLFAKDKKGKSVCSGSCAVYWPPLITSGKPHAAPGVKSSLLGTTRRADGRLQVTYRRHPLYRYAADAGRGSLNGQGLDASGGKWWVLSPAGNKIVKSASPMGNGGY